MTIKDNFSVIDDSEVGLSVIVEDDDLADLFDDFLTEDVFVLYNIRDNSGKQEFLFGKVASDTKLMKLIDMFIDKQVSSYNKVSIYADG